MLGTPAIVMHDAGSAIHISHWVQEWDTYIAYAQGPASELARCYGVETTNSLREAAKRADWLLVGTGSDLLSQQAMRLGKEMGLPVLAVLDHWTNYRERFSNLKAWELPDGVIVTDLHAQMLARAQIPWAEVHLWPNYLLQELQQVLLPNRIMESDRRRLLLLSEPLATPSKVHLDDSLHHPLARVEEIALSLGLQLINTDVILRLHPRESLDNDSRCEWIFAGVTQIERPTVRPIYASIADADAIVGVSTYALFLAWSAGCRAYSVGNAAGIVNSFPPESVPQLAI